MNQCRNVIQIYVLIKEVMEVHKIIVTHQIGKRYLSCKILIHHDNRKYQMNNLNNNNAITRINCGYNN